MCAILSETELVEPKEGSDFNAGLMSGRFKGAEERGVDSKREYNALEIAPGPSSSRVRSIGEAE